MMKTILGHELRLVLTAFRSGEDVACRYCPCRVFGTTTFSCHPDRVTRKNPRNRWDTNEREFTVHEKAPLRCPLRKTDAYAAVFGRNRE